MEKRVLVDGLTIRCLEEGTGPVILLLHGASAGSSADVWAQALPPLAAAGFRAVAFDQPGYGLSDSPTDYSAAYRAAIVPKLLDAMGVVRACLVGHSMAGGVVVRLALEHPDRVSQVVTVSAGSLLPPLPDQAGGGRGRGGDEGEPQPPTIDDARKVLEQNLFNKSLITQEALETRHRMMVGKNFEASIERSKAREAQRDPVPLWQRLGELSAPLLLLYGDKDPGFSAEKYALLKEREPGLRSELFPNASHLLWWDAPEGFSGAVLDFLAARVPG